MNKLKIIKNIKLTEEFLGNEFEKCLREGKFNKILPMFNNVLRELSCKQGIADFICFSNTSFLSKNSAKIEYITNNIGKTFIPVISLLLNSAPLNEIEIANSIGYSREKARRIIKILIKEKILKESRKEKYCLYSEWTKFNIELWAFELKLSNWKRALYQSTQSQSFASNVVTVFPFSKKDLLLKNINKFEELKVACLLFDPYNHNLEVLHLPNKSELKINPHYLFALTETIMVRNNQ